MTGKRGASTAAIGAFEDVLGRSHVLTRPRSTAPYAKGSRFGGGAVLAVVRPGSLVEMWRVLRICVAHDLIVIPQSANTGLTGGSGPGDEEYDRDVVIVSTLRIDGIHLLHGAREAVCLAGSTLYALEERLAPHGREPHSVIGSSAIGASVVGGIANNSGGSQVRKGPAYTEHALFARVDEEGELTLVNHLGIRLPDDPEEALGRLERGEWDAVDVSPAPPDVSQTDYADHVRRLEPTPARFNADPTFLFEASGSAGKLVIFAVRTRTFPREAQTTTFYLGTNSPRELEELRRAVLSSIDPLPISGEYLGRSAFDLAARYGKDTFVALKYAGSRMLVRMFALKSWANGVFAKIPLLGPTFADSISQALFALFPQQIPTRLLLYRDTFAHHLILVAGVAETPAVEKLLTGFFAEPSRSGSFFVCSPTEATSATLIRFGAASAMTRYANVHRNEVSALLSFDVALRRDDEDWLEVLPDDISAELVVSSYYGHFFCHVLHQDHIVAKGVDGAALKRRMIALLEARGAALPAEHNYGRIYTAPDSLEAHYRRLDPGNVFNAGVGSTSRKKGWR